MIKGKSIGYFENLLSPGNNLKGIAEVLLRINIRKKYE
jgi:hypothetical protein